MQGGANWCHFAVRLARTSLHRDVKGARLGYEDEKYSFLVVSPDPSATAPRWCARLVPTKATSACGCANRTACTST